MKIAALLTALPLVIALNAKATSLAPVYHELACTSTDSHADDGTIVAVDYAPTIKKHVIRISEQTIMGPRLISTESAMKLLSKMIGGPVVYQGEKHTVIFNATVSPNADGSRRGTLTDKKTGAVKELRCGLVR